MAFKQSPPLFQVPGLSDAARQLITRLFFRSLIIYLLLDGLIFLLFGGGQWRWWLLFAAEAAALLLSLQKNTDMVREMYTPIQALEETADALNADQVDTESLRRLAARLDEINVSSLKTSRIQIPAGGRELGALATAINAMLERIDRGYQAQARFVSDASHELRTPISVIQGRGDNNTQIVHKKRMDLSDLADEVYRETVLLETGRVIGSEIPPGVLYWGDPGLIKQALRILVDNGVKYTPEGGSVTIRLQAAEAEGNIRLSVTDTGAGIAREELPRVFERFYRADQSRARETGGTGLGLPIAKWIAARHNGWIQVTSKPGMGSRFTLLLPWEKPPAESNEEHEKSEE